MKAPASIPGFLSHLTVYKGLPVPFFTAFNEDGTPDFRAHSPERHSKAVRDELCGICGKHLLYWRFLLVGPNELKQRATYMPAMHENCARFALEVCPFLAMGKREMGEVGPEQVQVTSAPLPKPERIAMVRTSNYRVIYGGVRQKGREYVRFAPPRDIEWYAYKDGKLEAAHA